MDQLAPKLWLTRDQRNTTFVEKAEADIAVQLSNEIRIVAGIEFIAFPPEFARTFVFSAALGSKAKEANVARTILQFLAGPETAAVGRSEGHGSRCGQVESAMSGSGHEETNTDPMIRRRRWSHLTSRPDVESTVQPGGEMV
jgi:hypothetical protein